MSSIRLVRHGRPVFDEPSSIDRDEFGAALRRYDEAAVVERSGSIPGWYTNPNAGRIIVCSELRRARDSVDLLGFTRAQASSLLDEARLPHPDVLPSRMSWKTALAVYRLAWLFGYRRNADGLAADRLRADRAADGFEALAGRDADVVAFGHGIMHRLIATSLLSSGWTRVEPSGSGYWSSQLLVRASVRCRPE